MFGLENILSEESSLIVILIFVTTAMVIYSIFVFYFYKFLGTKNIIELNLQQYNQYEHPVAVKFFAVIFYIIEYIILLPILTLFWFSILSILILALADGFRINTILIISAALVASVRITAYISEDLSKDLAKMVPFTLLAIAITNSDFFDINGLITRLTEIPTLLSQIPYFLIFIVAVELIMRIIALIETAFGNDFLSEN